MRVEVKYFDHDDLIDLNNWMRLRGRQPYEMSDLPAVGFTVSQGDTKIATCFLRRCEGNYGIVDGLASNPDADSKQRHAGLDVAIKMVCEEAKNREITHLIAWTVDNGTLQRGCERHGFTKSRHNLMTKELLEPPQTH